MSLARLKNAIRKNYKQLLTTEKEEIWFVLAVENPREALMKDEGIEESEIIETVSEGVTYYTCDKLIDRNNGFIKISYYKPKE